ncbi:MAG: DUF2024 family protein [Flavobacteriaceae bacterium]|nr:DUF2024 family protein [Flavobacteriaceae bacterium]
MEVSVYDTFVLKENGKTMHFDILVGKTVSVEDVYKYGKEYLTHKNIPNYELTTNECQFCHIETAPFEMEKAIKLKGYYIIEMENCN